MLLELLPNRPVDVEETVSAANSNQKSSARSTVDILEVVNLVAQASDAILEIYNSVDNHGNPPAVTDGSAPPRKAKEGPSAAGTSSNEPLGKYAHLGNWLKAFGGVVIKTDKETGTVSPLTVADTVANRVICDALRKLTPDIPIISEESQTLEDFETVRKSYQFYWMVDPLDGTKEFIKRSGDFTVNVGLCDRDNPIAGVVMVPVTGMVYYACRNGGAFKLHWNSELTSRVPAGQSVEEKELQPLTEDQRTAILRRSERIQAKEFSVEDEGLICVASTSHKSSETAEYLKRFKNPKLVCMGSSLKLLLVADGTAHIYPRLAPTSEWDTCAAHAIVNESGGQVLQLSTEFPYDSGSCLVYNKPNILNPWFVVYGRRV